MEIRDIFESITPGNIKDIPVLQDSMEIFIELLTSMSAQSIDIQSRLKNKNIKKEIVKTYLNDYYSTLDSIKTNQKIIDVIEAKNELYISSPGYEFISPSVMDDFISGITEEHFVAFRNYREKKGTFAALDYIYSLISTLLSVDTQATYSAKAGEHPFELIVEGGLPSEFFYYLVSPLARPWGFTTDYSQLIELHLEDYYFPHETIYEVSKLTVYCECNGCEFDFSDRTVIDVVENFYGWPRTQKIYFGGEFLGEYLEQLEHKNGKTEVKLYKDNVVINTFGLNCYIDSIITKTVTSEPEQTVMMTEIHSFIEDTYDTDGIIEELELDSEYYEKEYPYINWQSQLWWEYIGQGIKIEHDGVCRNIPDGREMITIGDENLFIWKKIERLEDKPQYYAKIEETDFPIFVPKTPINTIDDLPKHYNKILDNSTEGVIHNPRVWDTRFASVAGDQYNATVRYEHIGIFGSDDFYYITEEKLGCRLGLPLRYNDDDFYYDGSKFFHSSASFDFRDETNGRKITEKIYSDTAYHYSAFNQKSDFGLEFGVYRNGVLLPDNNSSVIKPILVGDWIVDTFDVNGTYYEPWTP